MCGCAALPHQEIFVCLNEREAENNERKGEREDNKRPGGEDE